MPDLLSVGLDVGTTTTQMVVSRLQVANRASGFTVPRLEIAQRQVIYRSPVHFTPLKQGELVDVAALDRLVRREYEAAGIRREQVDTGAVIITGETSRKENAAAVLEGLSGLAGDFVVATAGPDLESVLAAKGAGAVTFSEESEKPVLHMDIGGGTANLALIRDGRILQTGCLNVGGRLVKLEPDATVTYVSPVLKGLTDIRVGQRLAKAQAMELAALLAGVLEAAAGLGPETEAYRQLITAGTRPLTGQTGAVISFSGGVADCIREEKPWLAYGDLGPLLGQAIAQSALCRGPYRLGTETIRATVIGAGCHSTQLSGSTVWHENVAFPLKDLPVAWVPEANAAAMKAALSRQDAQAVLALPGPQAPTYERVCRLADEIVRAVGDGPCYVALEQDMAKALGGALRLRLGDKRPILCLDGLQLSEGSYLDVGAPVGPALPVVIKTLVLETEPK